MFCDLVDSTNLSGQLDPEDLRAVIRAYQAASTEVMQRFEGHVAQYLGDGLLIYFGYPVAHEDDAQRAIRTGLAIINAMPALNQRLAPAHGIQLAVRIGIHTGLVVIGEMGAGSRQEPLALGETPNVAARMQELAAPDTVVISAATYRLVEGYFACETLGERALKGVADPVTIDRGVVTIPLGLQISGESAPLLGILRDKQKLGINSPRMMPLACPASAAAAGDGHPGRVTRIEASEVV
jgi:class 3 adenylate cyclase